MRSKHTNGEGHARDADKAEPFLPSPPPESDDGHTEIADKAKPEMPSSLPQSGEGQTEAARRATEEVPSSLPESSEGQPAFADKATVAVPLLLPDIEQTVARIRYWHRQRVYAMEQRKRADLSLLAFLRTALGWSKALPDAERAKIAKQAMALVAIGEADASGKHVFNDQPAYAEWMDIIGASLAARAPFDAIEKRAKLQMGKLAKVLPVYSWAEPVRGFGDVSLAVIVAEAGDLANYTKHSKLWKRMGVAVMGDVRQGGLAKNASKEAWIEHGYNRQRRSRLWNIGDSMIKAQVRKVPDADGEDTGERTSIGDYGATYLARKQYELARDPEMAPIKAHRRAQRYMEKRLLRNLWQAWTNERKANMALPEKALVGLPSAHLNEEMAMQNVPTQAVRELPSPQPNERKAQKGLPEMAALPMPSARLNEEMATRAVPPVAAAYMPSPQLNERKATVGVPEMARSELPSAHLNEEMASSVLPPAASAGVPSPQPYERKAKASVLEKARCPVPSARLNEEMATGFVPPTAPQELPSPQPNERKASGGVPETAKKNLPSAHIHEGEASVILLPKEADHEVPPLHQDAA